MHHLLHCNTDRGVAYAADATLPLSPPAARQPMHTRRIHLEGFMRDDGLMDVEARLVDTKPYAFETIDRGAITPGTPLHEMHVRITFDAAMTILAAEAVTEHGPFFSCGDGAASFARLVGLTIRPGFLKAANAPLAGVQGCTHIREMLQQIATVAMQTMWPVRSRQEAAAAAAARDRARDRGGPPAAADLTGADGSARLINTCHAYSDAGPVVQRRWPHLYTGQSETDQSQTDQSARYVEASVAID
jgi:hypothetical protein